MDYRGSSGDMMLRCGNNEALKRLLLAILLGLLFTSCSAKPDGKQTFLGGTSEDYFCWGAQGAIMTAAGVSGLDIMNAPNVCP